MRRLLAVLIIVGLLVAVVDLAVAAYAESRAEERASQELGAPASVDLQGAPVGLRLLAGRVARAEITARRVPLGDGAELDRLDVTLSGVRVRWGDVMGGRSGLPPAAGGRFTAVLDADTVQALMGVPPGLVRVRLRSGVLTLQVAGLGVDADVHAQGGHVVVRPRLPVPELAGLGRLRVDLSEQPGSPAVEEAEVGDGVLVLRGRLEALGR